ncbi:MAG: GAF domain-containing protein, partial [Chloroflexi bacterium]|nr:GAF domain-containing protein [Chloroflexota bacterium]
MPPRKTSPLDSIKGIAPAIVRAFSMRKGSEELTVERAAYAEIGRIVGIPFSNPDVYARFAAQVRRLIPFDMIVITQLDVERGSFEIKYTFGMGVTGIEPGDTLSLKDSVVEKVAESNRAIRTDHYVDAGSVAESLAEAGLLSRIGTPLIANDEVVGTLHLSSKISEHYGNPELTRLEIVGNQIAGAISSAIRLQEERERSNQLKSLYAVAAILAQPLSFVEKAQGIVDELASITEADYVLLRRADKEHKHLDLVASGGSENINLKPSLELSDSNLITRRAYLTGQPILINDYKLSEGAQTGFS